MHEQKERLVDESRQWDWLSLLALHGNFVFIQHFISPVQTPTKGGLILDLQVLRVRVGS
jgi:hypothetical protein